MESLRKLSVLILIASFIAAMPHPGAAQVSAPVVLEPVESPVESAAPEGGIDKKGNDAWVVNFKDASIASVIHQVALITGENYVLPPGLTGKITVVSQTPLKKSEVKDLLLSVLYINGFSVTPSGNTLVVQPSGDAKKSGAPLMRGNVSGEAFVSRVLPISYANLNDIAQAVQPLISDFAVLKILPDSNAILVADRADNVQKIADIIAELDSPEPLHIETIRLAHSWVGNLMPLLEKLAPREFSASAKPTNAPLRIVGDERSNSIILKGSPEARARLRALITELDQNSETGITADVIPMHNADATKIADVLKDMFGGGAGAGGGAPAAAGGAGAGAGSAALPNIPVSIKANQATNAIVVHGSSDVIEQVRKVVAQLDVQRPQVLIEAAIVEIDDDVLGQLGVQLGLGQAAVSSGLLSTSLSATGNSSLAAAPTALATFLQELNTPNSAIVGSGLTGMISVANRFSALIQALAANTHANLLSTPSITTINNEEAKILVGQNVPFLTGSFAQATTTTGGVNPFNTIQRQDIGITLKVTPQIHEDGSVLLKIEQEVSSIAPTTVAGAADIITNKRTINTVILAQNGQTVALGGLISDNKNSSKQKVPLLGDLPVIGMLFQSSQEEDVKSDLVVFLRPTVLNNSNDIQTMNARKYNGIWELDLDGKAKDKTQPDFAPVASKLYDPNFNAPPALLPWLAPSR